MTDEPLGEEPENRAESRLWLRVRRSRRGRFGALLLAFALLPAIFAEVFAADAPVVAIGPNGVSAFAAVVRPEVYAARTAAEIAHMHERDVALWPLVRQGPEARRTPDLGPSTDHPLGTDGRGRDVAARLVYGARRALGLGLAAMVLSLLLGGLLGTLAAWIGGIWDELCARPIELVQAFPAVLVVALARAIEPRLDVWGLLAAIVAVRWAESARIVRAEVLRISGEDFVAAARALGCGHTRVLLRHVLPHALAPVVASACSGVAAVVLLEVAASFLGIGVDGSWGALLAQGLEPGASLAAPIAAAAALALTVGACHLLGDVVGEASNARVATRAL